MARLKLKKIIPDTGSNIDYDTGLSAANKLNENSEAIESFSEGLMPSDLVHRSGNEVIAGVKTFTSSPKAPEPVNQNDLATKRYVDNHSGGTGGDTVDMFKKGVTTIDNSDFFPPDEVQYPIYITPGSYGVSFVDPPIADISNENNFTLIVEYASSDGSGADGDQDYTHTLVSQSGRRFTRTIKHVQDGISVSEFEEVYGTKAFLEENYVKKTVVDKITEYYRIEEDDDWFDIDANTKENVNIELAWNGTLAFDSPLGDDKSVLIQLKSLDLTQDYKVKLQVDGDILLDESNNEVELGDGVTIFAIYSSVQDKWTVTWSTTQEEPAVEDYSDVAVKQMLTSGGQLVAPGNNKRLFFTGTSGLNVGDLFFYNYGSHYFTGLYRVFNSGGTIVYADRIAERTTLRTVRVAGGSVYYNQYDGTNASTVAFTKKDSLSDFTDDAEHRVVTDSQVNTWNDKQNALGYTPEQEGVAQSLIDSLKGGVSEEGDTLYKLYALIVSSFSEISVQDTVQRNAYDVTKLPTNIFVLNDGDSKWALYKCVSTGVDRVDDVKISDPDLLNTVMTASQIKASYESNADTNAFTNAEKTKVGNTSGVNSGDETKSSIYSKLGVTQYGGIISANLDTINENNKYTAYGTAIGVPSSSYSWFIDHQNSNVGTSSATQRAIAYSTTLIIYERVKQGGTWGSWIKQNVLSDAFISTWNSKQSQLVSGENIKTLNGNSVLGSGNIEVVIPSQLNSEQSARIAGDATLDEKINQVSSGYLGFISNSDAAPTPGKNGFYEFTDDSETGPMWLDVGPIYAADKVSVVYDSVNLTYTYQLIPANVNYVSKGSAETITGEKTFSVNPKVPEPVDGEDAVNMNYVDNFNAYPFIGDSSEQKDIRKIISKIQLSDGFDNSRKYGIHSFLYHKDSVPNGILIYISDLTSTPDYSSIVCNITIMDFYISEDKSRVYKFIGEPSKKVNICFNPNFVQENIGGSVFLEFDSKVFSNIALSPKDFDETNPGFGDNLLYELNDYSKGKFTILKAGTTGKYDRVGVFTKSTTPSNLRVVFESSKNISSQLYWQSIEGNDLISPFGATWNYVDGLYRFSIEINASSTPDNAILFLFILNDDILTEPTWVSIASIREISKINGNQDYINSSIDGSIKSVKKISGSRDGMIPITVKLDGTGDFTNIQDAINFAKDASLYKQYDIQIFDDFDVADMTKLSYVSNPSIKNNSTSEITQLVALLITKNYVNIRGVGSKKMIRVISPKTLTAASYQFIQVIWLAGNCTLENLDVQIQGGRYAIHQESGGYLNSEDLNAKTQLINVDRKHFGNDGYPVGVWESVMAEADGTISGLIREDKNCNFVSPSSIPFYFHSNGEAKNPTHHKFTNCNIQCCNPISASQFNAYYGNIGSGHSDLIEFVGCNVIRFNINNNIRGNEQVLNKCDLWRNGGATLIGHSNSPMVCNVERPSVLKIKATDNKDIAVVGGSAYSYIFGSVLAEKKSTLGSAGYVFGTNRLENPWFSGGSYVFSLPHRLGNCAYSPKTLIVNVDGTDYTITFNQNYMTSDGGVYAWDTVPNISQQEICDYINSLYPTVFTVSIGIDILNLYTFPDCMEIAKNNSEDVFFAGSKLVRDYVSGVNCWKIAQSGDIVEAVCAEQINPDECGRIIFSKKAIFESWMIGVSPSTAGTMYKVSLDGVLEATTTKNEASFIGIDDNFLIGI